MVASIEYIQQVLDNIEAAAAANECTPGREGNVIDLTPDLADDVLVSADLHGHRRNFNQILKLADLEKHPRRHLIMQEVCHGGPTYPKGGCMSHTMLEDVCKLKAQFPDRFHFLLSNHEWAELTDYPILKGRKMLNLMFRMGLGEAYGPAGERVRAAFLPFLQSCPLAVRLPGGIFVCHTAPERVDTAPFDRTVFERPLGPADFLEHSDLFWLLWGRDYRPDNAHAFAKMVKAKVLIHGHDPCPEGFRVANDTQIILDCCGEKACVVLLPVGPELTQQQVAGRIKRL